jgi:uncharacterized membrane protein
MKQDGHLWAIGYEDKTRAEQVRSEIAKLGEKHCLVLMETAVAVRYPDGSLTVDGEPFVATINVSGPWIARLLAGMALAAPPLTCAAVGALLGSTGIDEDFIKQVKGLMKPGSSALFVLDQEGEMEALLRGIRGLGGTVLRTTVDINRAKLIQSTLAAATPEGMKSK